MNTRKYRLTRRAGPPTGFGGSVEVCVVELPADERPPESAEPVADDTPVSDWHAPEGGQ